MEQLKLTDLMQEDLGVYIKQTHIIENNMCWLLKAYYYCRALENRYYLYEKLDFQNDGIDRALHDALEQFSRLNKTSLVLTLFKLLCDPTTDSYNLHNHFEYVKKLYRRYGLYLPIKKIKYDALKKDIKFARDKFVAHSENIGIEEFRTINLFQYQETIDEMVTKYNQTLLSGTVNFNNREIEFVPITTELIQDTIINCDNGVAAMLSHVHNR